MVNYIIQVILFQFLFIVIYDTFFRKETFFNWNRVYLLLAPILSFVLPFIKISSFTKMSQTGFAEYLPAVILNPQEGLKTVVTTSLSDYFILILLLGSLIMFGFFIYKMASIFTLRQKGIVKKQATHTLVIIDKKGLVFSFFKSIFIDKTFIKQAHQHIIKHELIHIKQGHSIDLLFFELLKIVNWFNPAVYIFQNRITELHEFIADAKTIAPQNKSAFFNNLLSTTFKVTKVDFINQFYKHSLIKKRIMMTNKNKSKQILKLKYLLLVPALASMLFYVSCSSSKSSLTKNISSFKKSLSKKDSLTSQERKEIRGLAYDILKKEYQNSKEYKMFDNASEVPFAVVDQVPIYLGCEDAQNQKRCISNKITELVNKNFNTKLPKNLGLPPGRKRIFVLFKIDKTGKVVGIKARAPHKELEVEAIRVIKLIPQMKPGIHQGKTVAVRYSLPIVFNVEKK